MSNLPWPSVEKVADELGSRSPLIEAGGGIDFVSLLRGSVGLAMKHWYWIVGSLSITITLAILATLFAVPVYRANGTLQIEPDQSRIVSVDEVVSEGSANDSMAYYKTQYGLLESRTLAERVVTKIGIARVATLAEGLTPQQARTAAINHLMGQVRVAPDVGSRLVSVAYDDPDATLAADIVNVYMEEFISSTMDRRFEASSYARTFLEERLQGLRERIEVTERQLVVYAEQADLVVTKEGVSNSGAAAALESLVSARAKAAEARIAAEERAATLRSGSENIPELVTNPVLGTITSELNKAQADLEENRALLGPEYPSIRQLSARVASLQQQLATERTRIKETVRGTADAAVVAARQVELQLDEEIKALRSSSREADRRAIDYNILKRDLDTNKTLYDGLLQRYREIGIAGGVGVNTVSIVDRATVPRRPVYPRPILNIAIGLIAGLGLAALIVLTLENWRQAIQAPEDLGKLLSAPILGVIPKYARQGTETNDLETDILFQLSDNRAIATEAYHSMRASLQFSAAEGLPKSMLITSSKPSEGKTTTAVASAIVLARTGLKVLLIDADMRNPSLHKVFGRRLMQPGLSSILSGDVSLEDAAFATSEDNMKLVTSGPIPENAAALLSSSHIMDLLGEAERAYDVVVLDGPPILGLADAPILSRVVSATVFVVAANTANKSVVIRAFERLKTARGRVVGLVLTKFDAKHASYGGYSYGDSYGHEAYVYGSDSGSARAGS